MPMRSAIGTDTAAVTAASISEFGRRLPIKVATGTLLTSERPGSPESSPPSQFRYRSWTGRSRPSALRSPATASGVAAWPSDSCATSPGNSPVMANTATETASRESAATARRPPISLSMAPAPPAPRSRFEPDVLREIVAHQPAERDRAQALQLGAVPVQQVEEERDADARALVDHHLH